MAAALRGASALVHRRFAHASAAVSRTPQSMHDGFEKAMANLNGLHLRNEQGKFELPPASAVTPAAAKMPQTALQQSGMFEQLEGRAFQRAWESLKSPASNAELFGPSSIPNTLEPMLMSNVLKKRKLKMKKHKHKKRRKLTRALRKALKK